MEGRDKLHLIGWLYVFAGLHNLITQSFTLFVPSEAALWNGHMLRLGSWILLLPIGIGLLRHSERSRRFAVAASSLFLTLIVIGFGVGAVMAVLGGNPWERREGPIDGEELGESVATLAIGAWLLVWQLRELKSPELRRITEAPTSQSQSTGSPDG